MAPNSDRSTFFLLSLSLSTFPLAFGSAYNWSDIFLSGTICLLQFSWMHLAVWLSFVQTRENSEQKKYILDVNFFSAEWCILITLLYDSWHGLGTLHRRYEPLDLLFNRSTRGRWFQPSTILLEVLSLSLSIAISFSALPLCARFLSLLSSFCVCVFFSLESLVLYIHCGSCLFFYLYKVVWLFRTKSKDANL